MKKGFSRRDFLKTVSISTAGLMLFPGCNKNKYGDKIRLGFIGLGQQGNHLFLQFIKNKDVIVLAGADVYEIKRQRFSRIANRYYDQQGVQIKVETYEN